MELLLERIARRDTYTIGHLSIDGKRFCDTCEDTDRGLRQDLPLSVNQAKKRRGVTAIPVGRYRVTLGVKSPKYSKKKQYDFCKGFVPRLINVPAFEGILIHIGNTAADSEGCILVGRNTKVGMVLESTKTFKALYEVLRKATDPIYITVK
jgi:hypothetical protein